MPTLGQSGQSAPPPGQSAALRADSLPSAPHTHHSEQRRRMPLTPQSSHREQRGLTPLTPHSGRREQRGRTPSAELPPVWLPAGLDSANEATPRYGECDAATVLEARWPRPSRLPGLLLRAYPATCSACSGLRSCRRRCRRLHHCRPRCRRLKTAAACAAAASTAATSAAAVSTAAASAIAVSVAAASSLHRDNFPPSCLVLPAFASCEPRLGL